MSVWVRQSGTWKPAQSDKLSGRDAGTWGTGDAWVRDGNTWKKIAGVGSTGLDLTAPTMQSVAPGNDSQLVVTWTDNSKDEGEFQGARCSGSTTCTPSTSIVFTVSGSSPSTEVGSLFDSTDTGLSEDTAYGYQVRAASSGGDVGLWSSVEYGRTQLAAPTNLQVDGGCGEGSLSWSDASTANTRYRIERCKGAGCSTFAFLDHTTGTAQAYDDGSANAGSTYRWRIRAESTNTSNESQYVTSGSVEIADGPTLDSVTWDGSTCGFQVVWSDCSTDETGYDVHRCDGSTCDPFGSTAIASLAANSTSYTDTGPAEDSSNWTYGVRKKGGATGDQDSAAVTATAGLCVG